MYYMLLTMAVFSFLDGAVLLPFLILVFLGYLQGTLIPLVLLVLSSFIYGIFFPFICFFNILFEDKIKFNFISTLVKKIYKYKISLLLSQLMRRLFGPFQSSGDPRMSRQILLIPVRSCLDSIYKLFNRPLGATDSWWALFKEVCCIWLQLWITRCFVMFYVTLNTFFGYACFFIGFVIGFGLFMYLYGTSCCDALSAEEKGVPTEWFIWLLSSWVKVMISGYSLSLMAKSLIARPILIKTIGLDSYEKYVGANPGSMSQAKVVGTLALLGGSVLAAVIFKGVDTGAGVALLLSEGVIRYILTKDPMSGLEVSARITSIITDKGITGRIFTGLAEVVEARYQMFKGFITLNGPFCNFDPASGKFSVTVYNKEGGITSQTVLGKTSATSVPGPFTELPPLKIEEITNNNPEGLPTVAGELLDGVEPAVAGDVDASIVRAVIPKNSKVYIVPGYNVAVCPDFNQLIKGGNATFSRGPTFASSGTWLK